jgi:hypothetical protein
MMFVRFILSGEVLAMGSWDLPLTHSERIVVGSESNE